MKTRTIKICSCVFIAVIALCLGGCVSESDIKGRWSCHIDLAGFELVSKLEFRDNNRGTMAYILVNKGHQQAGVGNFEWEIDGDKIKVTGTYKDSDDPEKEVPYSLTLLYNDKKLTATSQIIPGGIMAVKTYTFIKE